ncbi:hypothetical protein AB7849_15470 [Rhodanobacter sp. 115]|uniref:hypothetical protein n=1 Tax=Rhodanobacter sp. FW021-MT20 TaxID=1162282 RepID=UPI0034E3D5E5
MALELEAIHCPFDKRYVLRLDHREVYPDDPGQGTPAMVEGPGGATATYGAATDSGVLMDSACTDREIPANVQDWLCSLEDRVETYINEALDAQEAN